MHTNGGTCAYHVSEQTFSGICHRTDTIEIRFHKLTFVKVSSEMFKVIYFRSQLLWCIKNHIIYLFLFVAKNNE